MARSCSSIVLVLAAALLPPLARAEDDTCACSTLFIPAATFSVLVILLGLSVGMRFCVRRVMVERASARQVTRRKKRAGSVIKISKSNSFGNISNEELLESLNVDLAKSNTLQGRAKGRKPSNLWQRLIGQKAAVPTAPSRSNSQSGRSRRNRSSSGSSGAKGGGAPLTAEEDDWAILWDELQFGRVVGEGNVGAVHIGWWRGTTVAIKQLLSGWLTDRDMITRFKDEIDLMIGLRHPNVLLFIGAVLQPSLGQICLVTEFCEHGSLYDYLHDPTKPMSWKIRFLMATDTARGMLYLHHRAGVIQRDLKTANLLIAEGFHIKIADFGLSRKLVPNGMDTYCGTPTTMAPEIVRQEPYTEKADVFSFGIILYELVTREDPYPHMSHVDGLALAYAVANDNMRPVVPPYCPLELARLMEICWDGNPNNRPGFVEVLQELVNLQNIVSAIRAEKDFPKLESRYQQYNSVSGELGVQDTSLDGANADLDDEVTDGAEDKAAMAAAVSAIEAAAAKVSDESRSSLSVNKGKGGAVPKRRKRGKGGVTGSPGLDNLRRLSDLQSFDEGDEDEAKKEEEEEEPAGGEGA